MTNVAPLAPLPLGASDFETLRLRGQSYVDKTELIYELASRPEKFFLTRPRRFGKSLLVSTFASLFKNGLTHFSGLAMEKLWKDRTYRVVEIDFSKVKGFSDFESFASKLRSVVTRSFAKEGFVLDTQNLSEWIDQLSDWLEAQPNNSLVLLIDEYDAPHTACLENKALFDEVRRLLSSFYAIVKSNDACWRFVFMTGITKFNQTGIFSELNNFTDISLDPQFGSLLGYTEEDIERYFSGRLERAATDLGLTKDRLLAKLRENYDGYCFDDQVSQHLYAPWSVLNFLSRPSRGFLNYWMQSGVPSALLDKYLHSHALQTPTAYGAELEVSYEALSASTDFDHISDLVLLTQAGYLTIKRRELDSFYVSYPNLEVAASLAAIYANQLLNQKSLAQAGVKYLQEAFQAGLVDDLFTAANRTFASIDYAHYPISDEKTCQSVLQIFLTCAGFDVISERHGALGRSDLEADADNVHWVIELKYQRKGDDAAALLAEAVEQIKTRNYGAASRKPLVRAAAVFSEEKRSFSAWATA